MMTARIAGIGAYVPENLITNDDLRQIVVRNQILRHIRAGEFDYERRSGEDRGHE